MVISLEPVTYLSSTGTINWIVEAALIPSLSPTKISCAEPNEWVSSDSFVSGEKAINRPNECHGKPPTKLIGAQNESYVDDEVGLQELQLLSVKSNRVNGDRVVSLPCVALFDFNDLFGSSQSI
jgi:hypothetical protein